MPPSTPRVSSTALKPAGIPSAGLPSTPRVSSTALKPAGIPSAGLPSTPRVSSTALKPAGIPGWSAPGPPTAAAAGAATASATVNAAAASRIPCASTSEVSSARDERVGIDGERDALAMRLPEERLEIGTLPLDGDASILDPLIAVSAGEADVEEEFRLTVCGTNGILDITPRDRRGHASLLHGCEVGEPRVREDFLHTPLLSLSPCHGRTPCGGYRTRYAGAIFPEP